MKEHHDLVREWKKLEPGERAILATVVETEGSVYRKPGARMLMSSKGWLAGSISGGCIESDLVQSAFEKAEQGPVLLTYDTRSDDDAVFGYGTGCNGLVRVLAEPLEADGGALAILDDVLRTRRPRLLKTVISEGPMLGKRFLQDAAVPDELTVLAETLIPPQALILFGAGHDALPLTRLAQEMGWHITVVDPRMGYLTSERFPGVDRMFCLRADVFLTEHALEPGAAVVVMTHSYLQDAAILRSLARREVGYLGLLGPKKRTNRLLAEVSVDGICEVRSPIGLDLGAQTPEEIALAIVAEILALSRGRRGAPLSGGNR